MRQPLIRTGYAPPSYSGSITAALTGTATTHAYAMRTEDVTETLASVLFYASAVTGNPTIECVICTNTQTTVGNPDLTNILATTTLSFSAIGWQRWSFSSPPQLEPHRRYWAVLRGGTSTDGCSIATISSSAIDRYWWGEDHNTSAGVRKSSTDSGTTWGSVSTMIGGYTFEFADGSFFGLPARGAAGVMMTTPGRDYGIVFRTPKGLNLNLHMLSVTTRALHTSLGPLVFRLYREREQIRVLPEVKDNCPGATGYSSRFGFLTPPEPLWPDTEYAVIFNAGSNVGAGVHYRIENFIDWQKNLTDLPLQAQIVEIVNGVWTLSWPGAFPFLGLGLEPGIEGYAPPLNRRQYLNQR